MKTFTSIENMLEWFNDRCFDDDIAFIKSIDQQILISTEVAKSTFNIYPNQYLDASLLMSDIDEVVEVDNELLNSSQNGVVYELWSLERPKLLYWNKRLVCTNNQVFIIQELHPSVDTSNRSIVGAISVRRDFSYAGVKEKFTEKERAIMFLLIHGLSVKQVADVMFVSPGTIKGHLWDKIRPKFMNLGYDVPSKDLVIEVACTAGMGDVMPTALIPRVKITTKIIKKYDELVKTASIQELNFR